MPTVAPLLVAEGRRSPPTTRRAARPTRRLIAFQMYWRGETFYTKNEIYEGPTEERTVFDQEGADEKLKEWMTHHRGRRLFFLFERGQQSRMERPAAARGARSFQVVDEPEQQVLAGPGRPVTLDDLRRRCRSIDTEAGRGGERFRGAGRGRCPHRTTDARLLDGDPGQRRLPARAAVARTSARWPRWRPIRGCASAKPARADLRARCGAATEPARATSPTSSAGCGSCGGHEMLRLGARELGWGTTEEVAARAVGVRRRLPGAGVSLLRRGAAPRDTARRATDERRAGVASSCMAMGKLGGEELNFSSDVDVCYFYSTDAGAARATRSLHEYYARAVARGSPRRIEQATGDGMIFRVDLRLRPEGRSGPAVQLAGGRRALLRDVRPHLGAAGAGCGRGRARATARWATSCWRCWSRSSTRAASTRAWSTRCAACARCSAIRPTRPARSARPASTSSWARAASATSRWSCRRCSCCTRASGRTCASATRRGRCRGWWWPAC